MTSKLEKIKRQMADEYMMEHPGVPRQRAKALVHKRAEMALHMLQLRISVQTFTTEYQKAMKEFMAALHRSQFHRNLTAMSRRLHD